MLEDAEQVTGYFTNCGKKKANIATVCCSISAVL